MYMLIEGMPCTGKTTISKMIGQMIGAQYMKSVVSDSKIGEYLKCLRLRDSKTLEFFYIVDGLIDELKVRAILDNGEYLVRDKCFVSSMAHLLTYGVLNSDEPYRSLVWEAYEELAKYCVIPDWVLLMEPNLNVARKFMNKKVDLSEIDRVLLSDENLYLAQHVNLKKLLHRIYGDRVVCLRAFDMSSEDTCDYIINELKTKGLLL